MLTIVGFRVFFNVRIVCGAKTQRICNCSYPGTFLRSRRDICFWTFHIKNVTLKESQILLKKGQITMVRW
jgi:hypothetical protein